MKVNLNLGPLAPTFICPPDVIHMSNATRPSYLYFSICGSIVNANRVPWIGQEREERGYDEGKGV